MSAFFQKPDMSAISAKWIKSTKSESIALTKDKQLVCESSTPN